jgi:gliding motility-associated-like protein
MTPSQNWTHLWLLSNRLSGSQPYILVDNMSDIAPCLLDVTAVVIDEACGGGDGSVTVTVNDGTPPYTYQWSNPPGGSTNSISNLSSGNYSITITDNGSCPYCSFTGTYTVNSSNNLTVNYTVNTGCGGANDASIDLTVATGNPPYSYTWADGPPNTEDRFNLSPGTYYVTVIDAGTCSTTLSIDIVPPPALTASISGTNVSCNAGSDGNANLTVNGGTPSYTYIWSPGGQTTEDLNNIPAGNYSVTVTDANSCTTTASVSITEPSAMITNITGTDVSCNGGSNGSADLTVSNGTFPYTYIWSPGGQTTEDINNIPAGIHCVTVTDANTCSVTTCVTITEPTAITANITGTDVLCNGGTDGSADLTVSGGTPGYTYIWSPGGQTTEDINNITVGVHCVTVTDAHLCTVTTCVTITEPTAITASITGTDVLCNGGTDGSADLTVNGGTPGYTYLWSGGQTTEDINNIVAGVHCVTITDAHSCTGTTCVTITEPSPIILSTTSDQFICIGQNTVISVSVTGGGTPSYTYLWSPATGLSSTTITNPIANPTVTTTYVVTVTDSNNCTATDNVIVTINPNPIANAGADKIICDGFNTIIGGIPTASGGTQPYTYLWGPSTGLNSTSVANPTANPSTTTVYTVTVTDDNGCMANTDDMTVTVNPSPNINFAADVLNGCEPLFVNFTDNTTPNIQSYIWNFGDPNSGSNNVSIIQNPSHLFNDPGTYNITLSVTTADGCNGIYTYQDMITVYPDPVASFYPQPEIGNMVNPNILFIDQSINADSWNWNFGEPTSGAENTSNIQSPNHTYSDTGRYIVWLIVTSQYGCIDSTYNDVIIKPEFTFYVPNAFTPDGDGINDYFGPKGTGIELNSFEMYVYDRWGEEIYKTNNMDEPWDGKVRSSSADAQQGVYSWLVFVKALNGKSHKFIGHVTLVR